MLVHGPLRENSSRARIVGDETRLSSRSKSLK